MVWYCCTGSRLFLLFTALLFVLSNLGLGLFLSTVSKTQNQAMMASVFALMMPMIYLSGFAFPIENMPEVVIHNLSYSFKIFYYNTSWYHAEGIGFTSLWLETLILFGMGAGILILSSLRFSKKIE